MPFAVAVVHFLDIVVEEFDWRKLAGCSLVAFGYSLVAFGCSLAAFGCSCSYYCLQGSVNLEEVVSTVCCRLLIDHRQAELPRGVAVDHH